MAKIGGIAPFNDGHAFTFRMTLRGPSGTCPLSMPNELERLREWGSIDTLYENMSSLSSTRPPAMASLVTRIFGCCYTEQDSFCRSTPSTTLFVDITSDMIFIDGRHVS